ncbi:MAG: GPP34 family phosphoprotein [Holophagales bacterium]|nr:GPP34 family phosphoprotein [Holophagales bacterium]MYF95890.1 GPP34 family phosphoprotein [Holophagales bacterium]
MRKPSRRCSPVWWAPGRESSFTRCSTSRTLARPNTHTPCRPPSTTRTREHGESGPRYWPGGHTVRFAEELLLLLHSRDTGYFVPVPEWRMSCALAGAVLMDLAMEDRIDSDLETLTVVDRTPTGDSLLDPSLEELASEAEVQSPRYWVERLARKADEISDDAVGRLVQKGIFESDADGGTPRSSRLEGTPLLEPAQVLRGDCPGVGSRFRAEATGPAAGRASRRRGQPVGCQERPSAPPYTRLPRGLPTGVGHGAFDRQHGRGRPLPNAKGGAGRQFAKGRGGPARRATRALPGLVQNLGSGHGASGRDEPTWGSRSSLRSSPATTWVARLRSRSTNC